MNLQQKSSPQLACTASGMSFTDWSRRPVYAVHCKTFAMAKAMCKLGLEPGQGLATVLGTPDVDGLSTFRALRPFRTPQANSLRSAVAGAIRAQRRSGNAAH